MSFEPELGQALFSNSPWQEHEMQPFVEDGVSLLGLTLEELGHCDNGWGPANPCSNSGCEEFRNDVFEVRCYCWCGGEREGHESGCPPNFKCGDFEARWYKHVGRGNSQNRKLTVLEWRDMLVRCLSSLESP